MSSRLLPGEKLVVQSHRHWVLLARSVALPWLVLIAGVVMLVLARGRLFSNDVSLLAGLALTAAVGLWTIVAWIRWAAAHFLVTDQRVILNEGIFTHISKVIALDRIQDISTRQNLVGHLLGYGWVEIDAAGAAGKESLAYIPRPTEFRDVIFAEVEARSGWAVQPQAPKAPLP